MMRRENAGALKPAIFPSYPPPEGKTWYTTTEGVTIPIAPAQREVALKNLEEQGLPRPPQFDDDGGGYSDPGDDPESPRDGEAGYGGIHDAGEDLSEEKRRRGCCRCGRGGAAEPPAAGSGAVLPGAAPSAAGSGVKPSGCWGTFATFLTLLNPFLSTGCAGLCLPATTGLLASVGSFLGMGDNSGSAVVACEHTASAHYNSISRCMFLRDCAWLQTARCSCCTARRFRLATLRRSAASGNSTASRSLRCSSST